MIISFESRKKSYPAFVVLVAYGLLALLFDDRWQYCGGIVLSLLLFLGCYGFGKRLSFFIFKTADQTLYFPLGLGVLLLCTFTAASFSTNPIVFYVLWAGIAVCSVFEMPVLNYRIGRAYFWAAPFVLFAFWSSLTPTSSFDALSYALGLPHRYLAAGKMSFIPGNLFSVFPPFSQVLNLLFAGIGMEAGIKPFLILVFLQTISILVALLRWLITEPVMSLPESRNDEYQVDLMYMSRTELMVVPMLLLPAAWISIHLLGPEMLASLFFCAGVATLVKEFDYLTFRKLLNAAALLSFALWTKYTVLIYVLLLPLLWLSLSRWRFSRENLKSSSILLGLALLFWSPFLIRNAWLVGDPFYPMLAGMRSDSLWSPDQTLALERDVMQRGAPGITALFLTPFQLLFHPENFGVAAAIGLLPLLSLVLYPFGRKFRTVNRILLYVLFCYVGWVYLFKRFSDFLPPFVFLFLASYFAFRYLFLRSRIWLGAAWVAGAVVAGVFLFSAYARSPLIFPGRKDSDYLRSNVDYYPMAEQLDREAPGKVLLLGETRTAYFHRPVLAASPYDQIPLLKELQAATTSEEVATLLGKNGVRYVVYNPEQLKNLSETKGVWKFPDAKIGLLSASLARYGREVRKSGNVLLYEIKDSPW
jgi:hypothetical protein